MSGLTPTQRDEWDTTGRLRLAGAFSIAEVDRLDRAVREIAAWAGGDGPGLHHWEMTDDGPRLARSEDFEPHHEELSTFLRGGLLVEVLTELFGEPPILFKEKVNYKHPGGAGFAPHQDATAYRFVDHHISVMVPLDPATVESGCLWFTTDRVAGIVAHQDGRIDPGWVDAHEWVAVEVEPGDVVFFDSYTPHHSGSNRASRSRRAIYLTYNAASAGDFRDRYYADKEALLSAEGDGPERARLSVNDDFLGRPVGTAWPHS